jgi:hypothetical protein
MISKLEMYGIGTLAMLLVAAASWFYAKHEGRVEGRAEVQKDFDAFKSETNKAALKAEAEKLAKEKEYDTNLRTARSERDVAIGKLQVAAARPRSGFVPAATGTAPGDSKICYERTALDGALRNLDQGVSRLLIEGDGQIINAITLLKGWPK